MLRLVVGIFLSSIVALPLPAQSIAVAAEATSAQEQVQAPERISVAFERTPLQEAIWTISKRSGRNILFTSNQLPSKPVTYKATGVTADVALGEVLRGTGMRAERIAGGTFKLVKGVADEAQGIIIGKVTDGKTGRGIAGVTVSVGNDARGVTADDGSYRIIGVTSGTHTMSVRMVGYAKQTTSVVVGEGATVTVDFKLEPSANTLDQVVVTGTVAQTELRAVPNAITVITSKQIEERGITKIDQLFRGDVPGLFAVNKGSDTDALLDEVMMFSRGTTSIPPSTGVISESVAITNPIKTYIDGVELADPKYLSQLDPKSIERIETKLVSLRHLICGVKPSSGFKGALIA